MAPAHAQDVDARCCFVVCQCENGHVILSSLFADVLLQGKIQAIWKSSDCRCLTLSALPGLSHEAHGGKQASQHLVAVFWPPETFGSILCSFRRCLPHALVEGQTQLAEEGACFYKVEDCSQNAALAEASIEQLSRQI